MHAVDGFTQTFPQRDFKLTQPKYLTNNWRMIQASEEYTSLKSTSIKATQGVINVVSDGLIVRNYVGSGLDDGYYRISGEGVLVPSANDAAVYNNFDDLDAAKPDFAYVKKTPPIPQSEIRRFVDFLGFVRNADYVSKSKRHIVCSRQSFLNTDNPGQELFFGFDMPVNSPLLFDAHLLKLAFTEALRYDHIYIGFDARELNEKRGSPMIIGLDWGNCVIVAARRSMTEEEREWIISRA